MAQQRVVHGAMLDIPTLDEIATLIPRASEVTRIRNTSQVQLAASGGGQAECYIVPAGYEFAVRRVTFYFTVADPTTGAVALTGAGKGIAYLRSGQFVEWAQPSYGSALQVPGVQTWGDQQGPYLRNKESFEALVVGLTASALLTIVVEGLLHRPASNDNA